MLELIIALSAAPPVIAGLWTFEWWRSGRRNRRGECGSCRQPLSSATEDRFLIGGRLICTGCAGRMKKHLPWELGALSLIAAAAAGGGLLVAGGLGWALGSLVTFPLGLGVIQLMKWANRRTQRRIAAGESPDVPPGQADSLEVGAESIPPGTAF